MTEEKWYDRGDHIRLFHGTSSFFKDSFEQSGISPPNEDLMEYAKEILSQYLDRSRWTPRLLEEIEKGAARHFGGRHGENGAVIYCMTNFNGPRDYAISLYQHGGEIAKDVYDIACRHVYREKHPEEYETMTFSEWRHAEKPFEPRYASARPMVCEILIPKDWCIWNFDIRHAKENIIRYREEGHPVWPKDEPLEDQLDDMTSDAEVRIAKVIPPENIVKLHIL